MNIDELTIGEAREISKLFNGSPAPSHQPYTLGANYIFRTVTMTIIGRVTEVGEHEVALKDACWVADSGRWNVALRDGELSEVEPCPDGQWIVGRGAIVDAGPWRHDLPRQAK